MPLFDDGNRVIYSVTTAMEDADIPAVSGGAVAQQPAWEITHIRFKELGKMTEIECIVWYYWGVD